MNEIDKELRLAVIETWKQALMLDSQELSSVQLEMKSLQIKASMLETKERLYRTRLELARFALDRLGVKNA